MEELTADVLVAGGGVAGLIAATRAQLAGARVALLLGAAPNSNYISGMSTVLSDAPQDLPAAFFNDLFVAGGFIGQPSLVATMAQRIGAETLFLDAVGVPFERQGERLARRQAAGSSRPWAVFTHGLVGVDICRALLARLKSSENPPVVCLEGGLLMELGLLDQAICGGLAYTPGDRTWIQIHAPAVVLATGGAGRLYARTYNPMAGCGFGHALALEAGARLVDMEFVTFEPTVLAAPPELGRRGIPTTLLREGARLRNAPGEEFLDTSKVLTKDVINRAMVREIREGRGTPSGAVYYDLREMPQGSTDRYVELSSILRRLGQSPEEAMLEVAPAQQAVVGGIRIDQDTATGIAGLYAAGEVTGGVHGAHRLATCGGTDALAFGAVAGEEAARYARTAGPSRLPWSAAPRGELLSENLGAKDREKLDRTGEALDRGCGILREAESLENTLVELRKIRAELSLEGRLHSYIGRAVLVALCIAASALARTESRGDHFRLDYPERDDLRWLGNLSLQVAEGPEGLSLAFERAGISTRDESLVPGHPRPH